MDAQPGQITSLLSAVSAGQSGAAEQLWHVVYDELHRIAKAKMAQEGFRSDMLTTVLVQEAYLKLVGRDNDNAIPENRKHFFAAAGNAMRQFLVEHARKRESLKRGGDRVQVDLNDPTAGFRHDPAELLAINEALKKLAQQDEQKAEIVKLRYFAGLTIDETAEALELSPRTVDSEWHFAKAWLHRELS